MPISSGEKLCFLEDSIKSMINQTLRPVEFVFVFDQPISKEMDSLLKKLVSSRAKIKYIEAYHLCGCGLGALLKAGVEACSCTFIARMDSDDISLPVRCQKELEILNTSSTIAVVGSFLTEFELSPIIPKSIRKVPEKGEELIRFAKLRNPLNHPTVMFRKSSILKSGNYNPSFSHCEDYELWYRIIKSGYSLYNIQESLLFFRSGNDFLERRSNDHNIKAYSNLKKIMKTDNFINHYEYLSSVTIQYLFAHMPISVKKIIYQQLRTKYNEK
jgi:glycosyltransferase involved in cell wall biosynthesis